MIIIREGFIPEQHPIRLECDNCHTIFEFAKSEAELVYDQRDGNFLKIACPMCFTIAYKDAR